MSGTSDAQTAKAFSESWNRIGSVYTREQFLEWFQPLTAGDLRGQSVLELGFGNGSLLYHMARSSPSRLAGIELGDTIAQTRQNLEGTSPAAELHRGDLTTANLGQFDLVYCIGVLHHLEKPEAGFESVLRHTKPGGRFHCWVYAREGNAMIRAIVEPVRRIASRLPWWLTKYGIALPMVTPYFLYAKFLRATGLLRLDALKFLPLFDYTRWIAGERFGFFHHVAFDQLVTPRTDYISRERVEGWLKRPEIDPKSKYVILRNGNSWKFGGSRA